MKKVFSTSSEVAHLWANEVQNEARCRNTSMYALDYGDRYYSYGTVIAQRYKKQSKTPIVLISKYQYSMTTSKHLRELRDAFRNHDVHVIECREVNILDAKWSTDHDRNKDFFLDSAASAAAKGQRARMDWSKGQHFSDARKYLDDMKAYSKFFGLGWRVPKELDKLAQAKEAEIAAQKKREAKIKAERVKKQEEDLKKWIAGEAVEYYYIFDKTCLRIKDDNIETTKGASVPVEHAVKVWPLLKRMHDKGETYKRNGHTIHLGHYALESFNGKELVVGCHNIPWSELHRIAGQLNLEV